MLPSFVRLGGYLWKYNSRISAGQKASMRSRMKQVDENIKNIYEGLLAAQGKTPGELTGAKRIDYLQFEFPKESEMTPRDKYTTFNRHWKNYRKPVHRVPKWTKLSFREDPKYF
ncbi:54S ribosomal protein L31, mitochondrial [Candida viswanathii]|uniref:54S ribosomal protein L31, mitochondrial n=1 Tax=Candida viswanathii TaxID=5486 RepID=A0A367YNZ5_9ASCO|nr:54S ribosomal protein L31, mitochondrial [Candida viswanathii]